MNPLPAHSNRPKGTIRLWEGKAPGALGDHPVRDIPTLTAYWPSEGGTGASVIVCPGGGYWELMEDFEGRDYALWLNERGLAAFVLKYRLASSGYHYPEITGDMTRAIRLVRSHAREWDLDEGRIGVMGSSAGGHLASYAMTHHGRGVSDAGDPVERVSSRPDLGILCYAQISTSLCRFGNLMGYNPEPGLEGLLSSELHVSRTTPPCFLWHTLDDKTVSAEHSRLFAGALESRKIPHSLHLYPTGGHSIGLGVHGYQPGTGQELHPWTWELEHWLSSMGWAGNGDGSHVSKLKTGRKTA